MNLLRKKLLVYFILPVTLVMTLFSVVTFLLFRSMFLADVRSIVHTQGGIPVENSIVGSMNIVLVFLLISNLVLAALLFLVIHFFERRYSRSLKILKESVVKLGDGQYNIDLPLDSGDDIGALYRSFNVMADQIRDKIDGLQVERFGRMRSVIDGEERERQRLSRELHDGIGQLLIAIKLRLESLLYMDGKEVKNSIQELKKYMDQIIDEVRRISNNLMPSVLEAFGLVIAFRNLFLDTEETSGIKIHFESSGNFEMIDKQVMTYVYRLTQEALNNIVKHAEARDVWVKLTRNSQFLLLSIEDNGIGFHPETAGRDGGSGIHNMRERASLLRGNISIKSVQGKGTMINLQVPTFNQDVKNQDFPRG